MKACFSLSLNEVTTESSKILESLMHAVENALEKKRLGQYAIILF